MIRTWRDIPGGLTPDEDIAFYQELCEKVPNGSLIVEVGTHKGKSVGSLAELVHAKQLRVWVVDIWDTIDFRWGEPFRAFGKDSMRECWRNLTDLGMKPLMICGTSEDVAPYVQEKPSLVYIDADHGYDGVKRDIDAWWPLVAEGGILAGHDFNDENEGVKRAVREKFGADFKQGGAWIWYVVKPKGAGE